MTIPGQADLAYSRVTVFGGSGFLGRQTVGRLVGDGALRSDGTEAGQAPRRTPR
jgi:uncharacterized protein YbjT (DUF2867 family)